ncbi:hypothetical protein BEI64_26230 [Eisenbergiella tayi]|nr:hypothetical protein BEI64_26230 [Eisenbergiella tayi]
MWWWNKGRITGVLRDTEKIDLLSFRHNMIINQFFHKDKSLLSPKVYEKIRNKKGLCLSVCQPGFGREGTAKV